MRRIVVLGSTGSIGTQTLDVVRQHPDKLKIVGLAVNTRAQDMLAQAKEFGVGHLAVGSEDVAAGESALDLATFAKSFGEDGSLGFGMSAVVDLVRLSEADVVVNALVGAAGLRVSYETLKAGKVLALANKESLVVGGDLIMPLAAQVDEARRASGTAPAVGPAGALMPIDSEHGAIYQCLLGENEREVAKLWVTASGGPFRGRTRDDLRDITPAQALKHPTWHMGAKISIDSSTLMNKGLEVIEARMTDVIRKTYFYKHAQSREFHVDLSLPEKAWYATADNLFELAHDRCDRLGAASPLYEPPTRMPELVRASDKILHHTFDAGEGVLIPAEILEHAKRGCRNFVILQPFGCLPNHVVGRGLIHALKEQYPTAQFLPLDYDPDVSFANVENRLQMLIMNAKAQGCGEAHGETA